MKQTNWFTGRRIVAAAVLATVTACGGLALAPAAFADSTVASATAQSTAHSTTLSATTQSTAQSPTRSAVVRPATLGDCTYILNSYGYNVTYLRYLICGVTATGPWSNPATAIAWCTAAMVGTGVNPGVAGLACTIATIPG